MIPFHHIFFDCDSTLVSVEGIDELAKMRGVHAECSAITRAAMNGEISAKENFTRKFALVAPSRAMIDDLIPTYRLSLVEDAKEVFHALHALNKSTHIISGAMRPLVETVAMELGISNTHIQAFDPVF